MYQGKLHGKVTARGVLHGKLKPVSCLHGRIYAGTGENGVATATEKEIQHIFEGEEKTDQ